MGEGTVKTAALLLAIAAFGVSAGAIGIMHVRLLRQDNHIEAVRIKQIERLKAYEARINGAEDAIWTWLQRAEQVACRRGV